MAERIPKTIRELTQVLGTANDSAEGLTYLFNKASEGRLNMILKKIKEAYKTEEERLKIYEMIYDTVEGQLNTETTLGKLIKDRVEALKEQREQQEKIKEQAKKYGDVLQNVADKALSKILEQNKQIFQTAKDMQLASNLTWKQYSQAYNEAFESARRINREVGQSITNARELIETQNFLMQGGFRGIDIGDLTNLSSSVFSLTRTLGGLPNELLITFQQSYRQFGSQTDQFVTNLGNRLNAFSNTFGVSIGMLSQTVSQMTQENAFLFRNNMAAQTRANENLMRAAALSGAMGLNSAAFVSQLAGTAQFGTMGEVAQLYQGGALLEGFDTTEFTNLMRAGESGTATEMLFGSIGQTLGGIEDQFLRAEYMQRIGSSFGLSRDDLLTITANSDKLASISAELEEKVTDVDTSMVDELGELKMSVTDRLDNWWETTGTSQRLGKTLQDLGLVGVGGSLKFIQGQIGILIGQNSGISLGNIASRTAGRFMGGGGVGGAGGFNALNLNNLQGAQANPANFMGAGKFGFGAAGAAIATGGNILGRNIQTNTNNSDAVANIGGGALNIGSGALGGAMIGSAFPVIGTAIGAGIGATVGLINTVLGAQERKSAMQDIEDQERTAARQRMQQAPAQTGDPIVDAINNMNSNLTSVLNDNFQESIQMSFVLDTANRTDAGR